MFLRCLEQRVVVERLSQGNALGSAVRFRHCPATVMRAPGLYARSEAGLEATTDRRGAIGKGRSPQHLLCLDASVLGSSKVWL
jgi:hypothetical protein